MPRARRPLGLLPSLLGALAACTPAPTQHGGTHAAPATVTHRVQESELTTVTLTPEAERRLDIHTAPVERRTVARTREVGGEVLAPPGRSAMLAAPLAGVLRAVGGRGALPQAGARVRRGDTLARLVPLAPVDRDLRAQADQQVASAAARLEAAEARATRAAQLAQERAGSLRASEEAAADRDVARATLAAARARRARLGASPLEADVALTVRAPLDGVLRQVLAADGQTVAAGAPLFEVTAVAELWVRVPVYTGDLAAVDRAAPASVRGLSGAAGGARVATPVEGPPTSDPVAITSDVFYALANADGALRPGERLSVALPLRDAGEATVVPWSAVVFDVEGGSWVYEAPGRHSYVRRRVAVGYVAGDLAVLTRGPAAGTAVVTVGAAELFGTEFGAGH
ncbi:MAG: efflux RND transporter periplasmic adaptor subunit [Deltaproteobacteria bacterium]|nr:efflux RND transporter periplasmic adaptor subunit [Deltaproteobacteria bacterium]